MRPLTHEQVKEHVESQGYKLLSLYRGIKADILVRCPNGHKYPVKAGTFRTGSRCAQCSYQDGRRNGPNHAAKTVNKRYLDKSM